MENKTEQINKVELPNEVLLKEVKKLIAEGHDVTLRVRGISMRPFLEDRRDKIVLTKVQNPRVGDAVLAEVAPGKFVFHRIVAFKDGNVTLKGDGNIYSTEMCNAEDISAATQAFIRRGKVYSPHGWMWRCYSALWPQWPFARRVLLKIYRVLRLYR